MIIVNRNNRYIKICIEPVHLFLQLCLEQMGKLNLFILLIPPAYLLLEIKIGYVSFFAFSLISHLFVLIKARYKYNIYILQNKIVVMKSTNLRKKCIKLTEIREILVSSHPKLHYNYLEIITKKETLKFALYSEDELKIIKEILQGERNNYEMETKI